MDRETKRAMALLLVQHFPIKMIMIPQLLKHQHQVDTATKEVLEHQSILVKNTSIGRKHRGCT